MGDLLGILENNKCFKVKFSLRDMIVVDVETTGVNPEKHSIVSIGAVDFLEPEYQFYGESLPWEGAEITDEALAINGFTREQLKDPNMQSLALLIENFIKWSWQVEDRTLAGENPTFDMGFLKDAARRYGFEIKGRRTVDLHSNSYMDHLVRGIKPPTRDFSSALSLDETLVYVGLQPEPKPHNALVGAKLEAECFSRLIFGKNLLSEYANIAVPRWLMRK